MLYDGDDLPLQKFGQFLISRCRDRGIEYFEKLAQGQWKAPALQELQAQLQGFNEQELLVIRQCVVSAIDGVLHDLLFAVQEHERDKAIQILVDGNNIAELSDGLHGDLFTWIDMFSQYPRESTE